MLDSAPIGMLLTRLDGTVLWANPAASRLLDADDEVVGRHVNDYRQPSDVSEEQARLGDLLSDRVEALHSEEVWTGVRDGRRWVASVVSLARTEDGEPLSVGGAPCLIRQIADITERKQAQEALARAAEALKARNLELERSNEDLTEFAYVASHDLSEPLRVIAGHVELLAARYRGKLDADADRFIDFAVDGCQRMRALIEDLLRYSRVGRQPMQLTTVSVADVLDEAVSAAWSSSPEHRLSLDAQALPTIRADRGQLRQIFTNLLTNAVKFTPDDRTATVHVTYEERPDDYVFRVADNGAGIPSRHRHQVFSIFKRLHGRSVTGSGIGLSICRKAVERHGGTIWVEDGLPVHDEAGTLIGRGTAFVFTIARNPGRLAESINDHADEDGDRW